MNQWFFVFAAYALVALATGGLVAWAYWSMRKAEADAREAVRVAAAPSKMNSSRQSTGESPTLEDDEGTGRTTR